MLDEFKNAFQRPNNGHIQLIIINVVIFVLLNVLMVLFMWFKSREFFDNMIYAQFSISSSFPVFLKHPWTLITYFFTHSIGQLFHILFNMLALYWFGKLLVEYLGSDKMIALYVLGGIAGAIIYLMVFNLIPNPPDFLQGTRSMVGASAAIFAIMVGAATLLPDYTFFLLFFGPVKIKYIAMVYIFLSFIGSVGTNAGGEIAHLGGGLMGYIYVKQLQVGVNWGGWITATMDWFRQLFKPKPKVKVSYRKTETPSTPKASHGISQKEIDDILDKISDGGYESLTKEEKEKLFKASKK